ncbi:MAG: IS4 family transposase [Terriglobia bacterium]
MALLKLHRRGMIHLPPAATRPPGRAQKPIVFEEGGAREPIRCRLVDLGSVEVVKIGSAESKASRVWNELMERYHYLGAGPLCGAQMRYLISSAQGEWLGGVAFSAGAWRVAARDRWIGWSQRARQQHLGKVVCNSRFLILPWVQVPNLASHVLSRCTRRLPADWRARYGYEPVVVETFVERGRFKGTCYQAANWRHVGRSCGRGRQDRGRRSAGGEKEVYLYPLRPKARELLCEGPPDPVKDRRWPGRARDWAEEELGLAVLEDERLSKRLLLIARDVYDRPQASLPQACQSRAKTKAAYRFFEHSATTMDRILASHCEATVTRVTQERVVLAVQDTTSLNYSAHPATEGLGPIGSKREGIVGLVVHDTMAFTLEGTPLGLLDVQCWARNPEDFRKRHLRYELPIEQKESRKWLESFRKVADAQKRCPGTTLVSVGDREADMYELFQLALSEPAGPKVLVRAERDRLLGDGQGHLWEQMAREPLGGIQVIRVPRRGQRPAREARLEVRFGRVQLKPPKRKPQLGELSLWAILAEEIDGPEGGEPLKWMVLTTLEVNTFEQATERLAWYAGRWGIEVYHRTLKSGCKVEERQLGGADRIETCLAIDMVVAWRIFHLTKLGRETPEVPCTVFFEEAEWKALYAYVRQHPTPPDHPPTLREAIRMVASLGGFLGRNSDGEPGTKSLWLGLQRLDDIATTWKFMALNFAPHLLTPPVPSNPGYG